MNKDLAKFEFAGFPISVIHIEDQPWWAATEPAKMLGYRSASDMTRMLDADEKGTHLVRTLGGDQEVSIINESGLWKCVIRSKRPEARAFVKFLTSELLPALRRDGFYGLPGNQTVRSATVADYLRIGNALKKERNRDIRAGLWQRMDQICDSWKINRLSHDGIGWAEPDHIEMLTLFWNGVRAVEEAGHTVNHSRRNHIVALNLPELRHYFHEICVPVEIDTVMTQALRLARNPAYLADKTYNCRDDKCRHCWIFSYAPLLTAMEEA